MIIDKTSRLSALSADERFMMRCIALAQCGEAMAAPNPMVGCVVVCDGQIIGQGFHRRCGEAHAEVNAIASVRHKSLLTRSTLYVSLEPCAHYGKTPPCADLIVQCGLKRVVVGCVDPFAKVNGEGIRRIRQAGIEVTVGVLEQECLALNKRFMLVSRQSHRPWITLKWAQSSDGFMAESDGTAISFSSPLTLALMHRLRTRRAAILVGAQTARTDNPSLTIRHWQGRQPLRLAIDSQNIIPASHHLKDNHHKTILFNHHHLPTLLQSLRQEGIDSLLVEGGATLLRHFIAQNLWDEARIETAPMRLSQGIAAPALTNAIVVKSKQYGGNSINWYEPIKTPASFGPGGGG